MNMAAVFRSFGALVARVSLRKASATRPAGPRSAWMSVACSAAFGESERNLRQALGIVEAMSPCIVCIDDRPLPGCQ